jgi:hypothetical protein
LSTFNGIPKNNNPNPVVNYKKKPGRVGMANPFYAGPNPGMGMVMPNPGGNYFGNPIANPAPAGGNQPKITNIQKIYNCIIYEKFINEFKRMLRKYPQKNTNDIMKHLFHGTKATDPKLIFASEDGLDIRFSNAGAYGNGIYFANNSQYSSGYAYTVPG